MARENMDDDEIIFVLTMIGETGSAQLRGGSLYVQYEAYSAWRCMGTVQDPESAQTLIESYFAD